MKYTFSKTIVIALGGSIVHPDGIDAAYLKKFKAFLAPFMKKGLHQKNFIIVIGGGTLSRRFQDAAAKVTRVTDEDKDWLGIHATRLNAHLLRTVFRDVADPVVVDAREKIARPTHPVTIASGWRPGWSTDYVAMRIAADVGADEAIIAGKPSHVYEADPAKHPRAKRFDKMTWREYRRLVPRSWKPGLHAPVDPVGARLGQKEGVKAIVIDGRRIANFRALLNGKDFEGTIIG
jgi:uridylate kinase